MSKANSGVLVGILAAGLIAAAGGTRLMQVAELKLYDARLAWAASAAAARQDIVLVEINDTTLRDLEPDLGRWPWPRQTHAALIDFIASGKPKVIAYDVLFTEADRRLTFQYGDSVLTGAESDAALAASVRSAGNVVLLADGVHEGVSGALARDTAPLPPGGYDAAERLFFAEPRPHLTPPIASLASSARALAHNYLEVDGDGPVRRVFPFVKSGADALPSLGVAAAIEAAGIDRSSVRFSTSDVALMVGDHKVPLAFREAGEPRKLEMLIRYEAAPNDPSGRRPYPVLEARHLLLAANDMEIGRAPSVDPAVFTDRIVFVGVTAAGLGDVFVSPFDKAGALPGIFVHASVAASVLSGRGVAPLQSRPGRFAIYMLPIAVGVLAASLPLFTGVPAALALMAGAIAGAFVLFSRGIWMPLAAPLAASALALFGGVAYQYFFEDREKRRVKQLFGRFVSKDVFERLLEDPSLATLGGARREMSVLFSDIRGFTSVSERGNPEEIVAQLNEYFGRMVDVVFRNGGTVDKFVGDMVMALFGAPLTDARHADHAVRAALEMTRELDALNAKWRAEGRPPLDIGIGINSGEMIAGNIGSERIMSYTVIGDAVNLGARLESLNKDYGTRIIISASTRTLLREGFTLRPLGQVIVKNRRAPVDIYEVTAAGPAPAETL
ncbi:MAG: adenylate/guanylate cyclase domain-containing protein [Acidobacteriota bacterium]|nr:adenylate/guanylate cyclase domain-containing protein [Acidobacteriota bacterium]